MRIIHMGERAIGVQETPVERDPEMLGAVGATDRPMAMYTPGREGIYYEPGGTWVAALFLIALFLGTVGLVMLYFLWR